jgi:hypothetical protein
VIPDDRPYGYSIEILPHSVIGEARNQPRAKGPLQHLDLESVDRMAALALLRAVSA